MLFFFIEDQTLLRCSFVLIANLSVMWKHALFRRILDLQIRRYPNSLLVNMINLPSSHIAMWRQEDRDLA